MTPVGALVAVGPVSTVAVCVVIGGIVLLAVVILLLRDGLASRGPRDAKLRSPNPPSPAPHPHAPPANIPSIPGQTATPSSPTLVAPPAQSHAAPPVHQERPAVVPPLDLATFAPLTDEQVRAQAAAGGDALLSDRFRFGVRGVIPPVTDPRTLLIDRAMVAHGFITPEELVEIHRVGDRMDEVRADEKLIEHRARQLVARALEDKAKLKEQRKAEAAERRRLRAEAVAHRRATDIIFLGRGVSKGLADRTGDVAKLEAAGLPVLSTPADVAAALGLSIPRLRWLAFHADAATRTHYVRFTVPKRSGGTRTLYAPHAQLAAAQQWILENVLNKVPTHAAAHGFVKGRSTVTNAAPHVGRDVVVNADLVDFFPTITFRRALGIFRQLGYSPAVATVFALLCTEPPRRTVAYDGTTFHVATGPRALPQGACTSPALSNLAARRLDSRLTGIATKLGYRYTRYADDLTFSATILTPSPGTPGEGRGEGSSRTTDACGDLKVGYLLARLRHIAQDEGFAVNEKKTRVLRQAARQQVTGVVVNARPGVPRPLYKRLRSILHRAKHEGLAAQNRDRRPNFEQWLDGMIAYVTMVNPTQGARLAVARAELSA